MPADRTAVFRALVVTHPTGTGGLVNLRLTNSTGPVVLALTTSVGFTFSFPDFVLNPGDVLVATTAAGVAVFVGGYGSLLSGAPE